MDRRRFLEVTGAATAAALTGCGGGGSSTTAPPPPATTALVYDDWLALGAGMSGSLILPNSPKYDQARVVVISRYDNIKPQAVARCKSNADIAAVLAFVRKFGLAVIPRSGGHGLAGNSATTGVVIDVSQMNAVVVNNDGTATIGAGATSAEIYDQLIAQGVSIPMGTCLTIGIAGLAMGGGIGVIDRTYGLTCDNVLSIEMVTVDGNTVVCDATHETDLFWALRGGGGGNFGVVTSFKFKTHPTRDLVNFRADYAFSDAGKVIAAWQDWIQTVPDSLWSYMYIELYNPTGFLTLQGVGVGTEAELTPHWARFLAAVNAAPTFAGVATRSYRDTMMSFCAGLTVSECHIVGQTPDAKTQRYSSTSSSDYFNAPMSQAGIDALIQGMKDGYAAGLQVYLLLDTAGGAISRVAPDATAFVHRNALFSSEYVVNDPSMVNPSWANDMRTAMKPWTTGGAYVNYMNAEMPDWQAAYYGSNYAKLVQVKAKYDPKRVFNMKQGIPPA